MATFLGIPPQQKVWLIRTLLEDRAKILGLATTMGSLDDWQLVGLPEGTIVTIVETYIVMRGLAVAEEEIFSSIERYRSAAITGNMPRDVDFKSYIKYRIQLEHRHGISDDAVEKAIEITSAFIARFCQPDGDGRRESRAISPIPSSLGMPNLR